jgi:tetratricopeptide (TPR) repeat protein
MGRVWISVGQCIQHHGVSEAYLPVLAALSQFARGTGQAELRAALQHYAPNWLHQLPALRQEGSSDPPDGPLPAVTSQRLMWELAEAFRVLTERRAIVLVFDDLQWSDTATVDWLAYLARWQEPLRLFIIGAYRPADVIASGHPLYAIMQELGGKGQSAELRLELLNRQQVRDYCTQRFPGSVLPARLISLIHRRTDGNPLFLVSLMEYLVQQGFLICTEGRWRLAKPVAALDLAIPHALQGMIGQQVEQLSVEEQRVLDVASVVGETFGSEVVAAGMALPTEQVEAVCDELVRKKQVIEGRGVEKWPDGSVMARYGFQHALFRDAVQQRLGEGKRIRLHRTITERLEAGYGARAAEIAGELAAHCTQGHDYRKGAQYHLYAADNALRLSAYREAITHNQQGLGLLAHLPPTLERDQQELALRMSLHVALGAVYGQGAQVVEENLKQAQKLARNVNDEQMLVSAVVALGRVYVARSDRAGALRIAEEDVRLVKRICDPALTIQLHTQLGTIHTFCAEYAQARVHHTQVQTLYATAEHESLIFSSGLDPLMIMYLFSSLGLWLAGWPDQSQRQQHRLLARAAQLLDIFSSVFAHTTAAFVALLRGDLDEARQLVDQSVRRAMEHGSLMYSAVGMMVQGCITARDGDLETGLNILKKALPGYRATSAQNFLPVFLSFLAEALSRCGKREEAFATIAEALRLAETSLEVFWEAELYRLKGELLLNDERRMQNDARKTTKEKQETVPIHHSSFSTHHSEEAEACFLKAIEIAHQQEAKMLELRAMMSLARLWRQQGKQDEARQRLAEIYGWFTEGFDTQDLQEARAFLDELE